MTKTKRLKNNPQERAKKPKLNVEDESVDKVEVNLDGYNEEYQQMENDSNMLIASKKKENKSKYFDESNIKKEKKKLTRKEKKRLEKVVERKNKSSKRHELLEKLATIQINQNELKLYSSVKDIGKKEKRKRFDGVDGGELRTQEVDSKNNLVLVNSIAGSNKKNLKREYEKDEDENDAKSIDTDDVSSDSEIDDQGINEALANFKNKQLEEFKKNYKADKIDSDNEEEKPGKTTNGSNRKTKYVHVERREEIKETRSKLPIITEEQLIMEKINDNDICIICGETGSGKTTQVPQFLYEAGYAEDQMLIGITEPRRVAAISMCKRVNDEMNFNEQDAIVSYQIRYEGTHSPQTKMKFMTDGVLLKEVQNDFMLTRYSAIIIDEAHERSVYTDILIGLLSRIVPLRSKRGNPLKLIIMSATLRVEDFTDNSRLFKQIPPVIKVDSRQFPVSIHFNKHTYEDYVAEAYKKVCKIHRRLPEGGILVFVTGQQEVNVLCAKLRKTFPRTFRTDENEQSNVNINENNSESLQNRKSSQRKRKNEKEPEGKISALDKLDDAPKINLDSYSTMALDQEEDAFETSGANDEDNFDELHNLNHDENMEDESDEEEENESENHLKKASTSQSSIDKSLYVLPLYSLLSSEKQIRVFDKVPDNCRLCVVATNIAETSLTIPNIKYVVDCGKIKMKFYDKVTGVSTFRICWTSKASADQRSGRAGRTSPGHCYRLYSSAIFNDEFPKFAEPEIVRKPVEDLILQMKDLGIDRIANFPFPTPPDDTAIKVAENLLIQLGALELDKKKIKSMRDEQITSITPLGKTMANFPISPRYSKMICLAGQQNQKTQINNIISYIICLISGLSVPELFIDGDTTILKEIKTIKKTICDQQENNEKQYEQIKVKYSQMRQTWLDGIPGSHTQLLGDLMLLLVALGTVEYEQNSCAVSTKTNDEKCMKFCQQYGIRYKGIVEARKLRKQLVNTVNLVFTNLNLTIDPLMPPPTQEQAKLLRQIVLSGMVDKIAKRYEHLITDKEGKEIKNAYQGILLDDPIFIHPSSVLFKELPTYVCYLEMVETSKLYMKGICSIDPKWLPIYLTNQCSFEKPIVNETDDKYEAYKPRYDAKKDAVVCHRASKFSRVMWNIEPVEVEFPQSAELFKWFSRFFLEGDVCESLKKYENVLLASPSTMLKSWAKLQPRTEALLNMLINKNCCNLQKLKEIWSTQTDYLLNEYLMWLPESLHFDIRLKWPPITNK